MDSYFVTTQVATARPKSRSREARLKRSFLESQGQGIERIDTLFLKRCEVGANGTEGLETGQRAKASGDILLHLGHAHSLFGDIVGERHIVIGSKAQDIVGAEMQSIQEIVGLVLLGLAPLAGRRRARIGGVPLGQDFGIERPIVRHPICRQGAADEFDLLERVDQAIVPSLFHFLEDEGQVAQVVCIAQCVSARRIAKLRLANT